MSGPARADEFADAVKGLNAETFTDKIAAIETLSALHDSRSGAVLSALAEGRLMARADGTLLIMGPQGYTDAISGQAVAEAPDASEITLNNRLRNVLHRALAGLDLASADPATRLKAAKAVAEQATPAAEKSLREALARETDAKVRAVIAAALDDFDLSSPEAAQRLAAVRALSGSSDPAVLERLAGLSRGDADLQVRKAATASVASIRFRRGAIAFGVNLFQGLSLGSVLLLAAIGLAITFGVMGVINMAHGEMIMLGAYAAFTVQEAFRAWLPPTWLDFYLIAAVPVAFLTTALVGIALERSIIRLLYGRPLETLLATFGISLILQQVVRSIFGAPNREVGNPSWMTGGLALAGDYTITWNRLVIIVFCLVVLGGLAALLRWSFFGLQMRAVAQNRPMAEAMGIPTGRIDAFTFGLGSGIAGIAGVALSQIGNVSPNLGQGYIVDSFMVVVFGGVGSLWGTLAGGLALGTVNKFLEPYAGAMLGKILVLVFIILFIQKRPRGLFALKGRSVES
jgi:urea transport system permease protein